MTQRTFLIDTNDILDAFEQHWKPRWNTLSQITSEAWQRIMDFTQHYMPQLHFDWDAIDMQTWTSTVKSFKKHAARGPDGFSKEDLVNMPPAYIQQLLNMLTAIENTQVEWPAQLAFGTIIGIIKVDNAHEEGQFRPITLFSMLYRCWSRIRTKQIIRQMAKYMPPEALGFLPKRETTEVWLCLQAQIELFLQYVQDLTGLSTDLRRAFNNIGRPQVFLVANRIGLPQQLLHPWEKFLNQFVRRFDIHGCLGRAVHSSSGFPEGCPLSILAMLNVNWCYHVYMKAFCPQVIAYSFVDNLTLAARQAFLIAQAYMALQSICGLFGLDTDEDKTYVWGLTRQSRQQLSIMGFPCMTDATELGGAMTFGLARRTRLLKQRGQQLHSRWQKLRRSMAPGPQKLSMLPKVFWPQAFYGSAICLIANGYANDLRKAAVKALTMNGAGSNPLLRLSLSDDMQADPGYYQLRLCLTTIRRMLMKSPDLLPMWRTWKDNFTGHLKPGPFPRLQQCLEIIGWSVQEPPWIQDYEGYTWNLQLTDHKITGRRLAPICGHTGQAQTYEWTSWHGWLPDQIR